MPDTVVTDQEYLEQWKRDQSIVAMNLTNTQWFLDPIAEVIQFIGQKRFSYYYIPISNFATAHGYIHTLAHLRQKVFVTPEAESEFSTIVDRVIGLRRLTDDASPTRISTSIRKRYLTELRDAGPQEFIVVCGDCETSSRVWSQTLPSRCGECSNKSVWVELAVPSQYT